MDGNAVIDAVLPQLKEITSSITAHLQDGRRGELLREGVHVAVIGPPNAGKSTLLNTIAQRPAAIVSEIPGTTRDIVEVSLDLAGSPVVLADTAGLRAQPSDAVEAEGIRRACSRAEEADIVMALFEPQGDITTTLTLLDSRQRSEVLPLISKADIGVAESEHLAKELSERGFDPAQVISCKTGEGIEKLLLQLQAMVELRLGEGTQDNAPVITRTRHRNHLTRCQQALKRFATTDISQIELQCEELRVAVFELGSITGRVDVEELLDVIFRDFCIGK